MGIDWQHIQTLLSEAWGYEQHVYNKANAIFLIIDHIYDICAADVPEDHRSINVIAEWFAEHCESKICKLCGNRYRLIDLPSWIYFGSNGYKSCCFSCLIMERPLKKDLLKLVPAFIEECGFIPASSSGPIHYGFTFRLQSERWESVIRAYAKMGGIEHVNKKYGSWFKALAETGALPGGVMATSRGIRCLAKDKHECHSLDEQLIDNWLFDRGFEHEREPQYPIHEDLNPSGRRRADWMVGDYFIEYFGLAGDPIYDKKTDEKILLAANSGITLITLYPNDLEHLEYKLGHLLNL